MFFFSLDIQFWNSRQSLEGLSVRSIIFGVFQSLVVLLYILDNETNFVVQVSVFIGLLIDFWKITKVMDVRVSNCDYRFLRRTSVSRSCQALNMCLSFPFQLDRENKIVGIIPRLVFKDKSTYVESSTKIYDDVSAFVHRLLIRLNMIHSLRSTSSCRLHRWRSSTCPGCCTRSSGVTPFTV